jgi:hypothetical protein
MGIIYNEDTGQYIKTSEDEPPIEVVPDPSGEGWLTVGSPAHLQSQYQAPSYANYDQAVAQYSGGKVPWDYTSLLGQSGYGTTESQGGLSSREAFNLNAIWGGTQYAQGRVTDFSHIDPTQIEANQIAGQTRDQLWNQYDQLVAQGKTPPKNPDQVALDFYVKNVGPQGNTFGYGPGANTVMLSEALKSQFLNQPEVVQATGSLYQTPPERIQYAEQWGTAHEGGVPTWQVFEQQGYSKDWFGSLIPAILGAMVFPGLSAGLAGAFSGAGAAAGTLGSIGAGALIGGTTSAISGGDFLKGAITGGVGGGLTSGLSGVSSSIVNATQLPKFVVDTALNTATRAAAAGAMGGDIEQAIIGSLVGAGISAGLGSISQPTGWTSGSDLPGGGDIGTTASPNLISAQTARVLAPAITSIVMGGDVNQAVASIGAGLLANSSADIVKETGLPKTLVDAAISAANAAMRSGAVGADVETAVVNSLIGSGVSAAAKEAVGEKAITPEIARLLAPVVTTALTGGDVAQAATRSGIAAVKQAAAADAGASYLDRFVDPQIDPTAVDPYLNQFTDQPATQVADTGAPTTVDSGLAAIDTTAPSTQVADAPSVPVDTGLAALEPPVQVAEAPVTQPEIVAPPTATAQAPSDLADMILKMSIGAIPKDMTYDANGDGRITSADAMRAMRGWTPSIPAQAEIAPTLPPTQIAQAPVDSGLGALAPAQPDLPIDIVPPSVVSDSTTAPIEVIGGPVYQGMPGSETLVPPEGTRLATYDEAQQIMDQGGGATTLPSGEMAFIVPDTTETQAPADTTVADTMPDITGDVLTSVPVDPYLDQFTDQPVDTSFAGVTDIPQDTGGLAAVTGGLPPDAGVNVDIPVDIPFDTTFTPPDLGVPFAPDIGAIAPDTGVSQINVTNVTPFDTSAYDAQIAALQAQLAGLTAAQQEQAMNLIAQGSTTQDAIAAAQANISAQLGEQITGVQAGLQGQIGDLSAAQQEQVRLLEQQGIDTQLAIDAVKAGLTEQITGVQTDLAGQITDVQTGLQGQISNLSVAQQEQVRLMEQQGITTQEAIDAVKSGLADQILGVQEGLTGQITGVQQDFENKFNQLSAEQKLQYEMLDANQQKQAQDMAALGIDLNQAITDVQAGFAEQLTGVQEGLTGQITGLEEAFQGRFDLLTDAQKDQALALTQQGIAFGDALNQVEAGLTGQISDVQAGFETKFQDLQQTIADYRQLGYDQNTALQLAMDDLGQRMDLSAQDMADLAGQFSQDISGVREELGIATSTLQDAIDNLSVTQQAELDARLAQGQEINQAIDDIQQGIDTRFAETGQALTGLGGQVSTLGGQVSGLGGQVSGLGSQVTDVQRALGEYTQAQMDAQSAAGYKSALAALANMARGEPNYKDPRQAYLTPSMLSTGSVEGAPFTDYASLIPQLADIDGYKAGGSIHVPGPEGRFYEKHARRGFAVGGPGTGQSDDIPTMLSDGEYVIDADTVAALGDGSSKAGAQILDKFREEIRRHKRSAPADRIPPKAKNPLAYLKSVKG